jgi:hypothetical protein
MAIIVEHMGNGNEYILLGVGLGVDPGNLSARFLKTFLPNKVAVCDRKGKIFWFPCSEVIVTEIDDQKPAELLPEPEKVPTEPSASLDFATRDEVETASESPEVSSLDEFEDDGEWL